MSQREKCKGIGIQWPALAGAAILGFSAQAATVTVLLQSPAGLPVASVATTIIRSPSDGAGSGQVIYSSLTNATGQITADVPSAGNYFVCAGSPAAELLDSCLWQNPTAAFTVAAASSVVNSTSSAAAPGTTTQQVKVTLQSGVTLNIHVNDPQGLVPTSAASKATGFLRPGVWSGGRFRFAQLVSTDSTGLNYSLVVPSGAAIHISFQSAHLQVADSAGQPVNPSLSTVSFTTPPSLSSTVQQFSVTSTK